MISTCQHKNPTGAASVEMWLQAIYKRSLGGLLQHRLALVLLALYSYSLERNSGDAKFAWIRGRNHRARLCAFVRADDIGGMRPGHAILAVGGFEGAPTASFGLVGFVGSAWQSLRGGTRRIATHHPTAGCPIEHPFGRF
jgi:hypothetical protein